MRSKIAIYNEAFQKSIWSSGRFRQLIADQTMFDGTDALADISASRRWNRRSRGMRTTADMVVILYSLDTDMRLALFVEHKCVGSDWNHSRPREFELRGIRCSAMQTMLIAPHRLIRKHAGESARYDIQLAYEAFSEFVPMFANEIDEVDLTIRASGLDFPDGGLI